MESRTFRIAMVVGFIMFLAMLWGLYSCDEARADYWRQTASLMPGTYMIVYSSEVQTAMTREAYNIAREQGADPLNDSMNFVHVGSMNVFVVTPGSHNATGLAEFFGYHPQTTPDLKPYLFIKQLVSNWRDGEFQEPEFSWKPIPLPCKWTEGEVAL